MTTKDFIEKYLRIVNKAGQEVPFILNSIQDRYLSKDSTGRDIILKARQQGFSSLILAMFTKDFIAKENSRSVIVADIAENASELLDKVKSYISAFEDISKSKVPLKYNSKYELYNEQLNSRYTIGTADNVEFGRSKTITNLHLSEAAFYNYLEKLLAGAGTAVVPSGQLIIETTANGFNEFKTFWEESKLGETGFKPLFYKASDFYDAEFLDGEKKRLRRLFQQEYPETDTEAFLTSGSLFFDSNSLSWYLDNAKEPLESGILPNV